MNHLICLLRHYCLLALTSLMNFSWKVGSEQSSFLICSPRQELNYYYLYQQLQIDIVSLSLNHQSFKHLIFYRRLHRAEALNYYCFDLLRQPLRLKLMVYEIHYLVIGLYLIRYYYYYQENLHRSKSLKLFLWWTFQCFLQMRFSFKPGSFVIFSH